jgi:uncharacterized radical SAM protein YgiQ
MPSLDALLAASAGPRLEDVVELPSHEAILADARELMEGTLAIERQVHQGTRWAVQQSGNRCVVLTPPAVPLDTSELDAIYALPYTRRPHPSYSEPIPAARMIQFSVTSHRGCAGGCTFCSLALHQGRHVGSRSARSIEHEVRGLTRHPDWDGSVSDVGGPTANMWGAQCAGDPSVCKRPDCLTPEVCRHFKTNEPEQVRLLNTLRAIDGVQHLRVASGVRHDLAEADGPYIRALVSEFVGGQLKLAPEHCSDRVLRLMRKPVFAKFERFLHQFESECRRAGKEQYVVPYLVSAFPGCTEDNMRALRQWLDDRGWKPRQVQCFIPTPGTVATAMYHAAIDPDGNPIPVARSDKDRLRQHHILIPELTAPEPKRRPRRT